MKNEYKKSKKENMKIKSYKLISRLESAKIKNEQK